MFFRIVGILWIALGIWWIMRPQSIRRYFRKKIKKTKRKVLFLIIILVSGLFFSAAKHVHGVLANVFLIAVILGIVKAIFFLASKGTERIIDWWTERPLWVWRLGAAGFMSIGILIHNCY